MDFDYEGAHFDCAQCGARAFLTATGVAHHAGEESPTGIDHDADGDHVAYPEPVETDPDAPAVLALLLA
jgi:hypothetical protein